MVRDFRDDSDDNRRDDAPAPRSRDRALTDDTDRWSPSERLALPRSSSRQPVALDRSRFMLRESEIDLLSTVGAFRAIQISDLDTRDAARRERTGHHTQGDLRSLREQGLLHTHSLVINGRSERVAVLTTKGRQLLERARVSRDGDEQPDQQFYAGLGHAREVAHDAQLYRLFETERTELQAEGASVTRVVLDHQLKAEYHTYVHEQQQAGRAAGDARRAFAHEHDLPFAGGRIHLPDVRIEYRSADGQNDHRDLELATEHYSRSQLSGKQSAGFRVYRAAGAGGTRRGHAPSDPHHLQWLS